MHILQQFQKKLKIIKKISAICQNVVYNDFRKLLKYEYKREFRRRNGDIYESKISFDYTK